MCSFPVTVQGQGEGKGGEVYKEEDPKDQVAVRCAGKAVREQTASSSRASSKTTKTQQPLTTTTTTIGSRYLVFDPPPLPTRWQLMNEQKQRAVVCAQTHKMPSAMERMGLREPGETYKYFALGGSEEESTRMSLFLVSLMRMVVLMQGSADLRSLFELATNICNASSSTVVLSRTGINVL